LEEKILDMIGSFQKVALCVLSL